MLTSTQSNMRFGQPAAPWGQTSPNAMQYMPAVFVATAAMDETRRLADALGSLGYRTSPPDDGRWDAEILDAETAAAHAQSGATTALRILIVPAGRPDEAVRAFTDFGAMAFVERPAHAGVLAAILSRLCAAPMPFAAVPPLGDAQPRAGEDTDVWRLNATSWSLMGPDGKAAQLTHIETVFLAALIRVPGKAVPHDELIAAMGHRTEYYDQRRLDTFVSRLRKKVAAACGCPLPLRSIHAFGYAFAAFAQTGS